MLIKRSRKNQIAIPKAILERAGMGPEDLYFDVQYDKGRIVLIPMQLEEKISPETLKKFEAETLKQEVGDKRYLSMQEAIKGLRRKSKR